MSLDHLHCDGCQTDNPPPSNFCYNCGEALGRGASQQTSSKSLVDEVVARPVIKIIPVPSLQVKNERAPANTIAPPKVGALSSSSPALPVTSRGSLRSAISEQEAQMIHLHAEQLQREHKRRSTLMTGAPALAPPEPCANFDFRVKVIFRSESDAAVEVGSGAGDILLTPIDISMLNRTDTGSALLAIVRRSAMEQLGEQHDCALYTLSVSPHVTYEPSVQEDPLFPRLSLHNQLGSIEKTLRTRAIFYQREIPLDSETKAAESYEQYEADLFPSFTEFLDDHLDNAAKTIRLKPAGQEEWQSEMFEEEMIQLLGSCIFRTGADGGTRRFMEWQTLGDHDQDSSEATVVVGNSQLKEFESARKSLRGSPAGARGSGRSRRRSVMNLFGAKADKQQEKVLEDLVCVSCGAHHDPSASIDVDMCRKCVQLFCSSCCDWTTTSDGELLLCKSCQPKETPSVALQLSIRCASCHAGHDPSGGVSVELCAGCDKLFCHACASVVTTRYGDELFVCNFGCYTKSQSKAATRSHRTASVEDNSHAVSPRRSRSHSKPVSPLPSPLRHCRKTQAPKPRTPRGSDASTRPRSRSVGGPKSWLKPK